MNEIDGNKIAATVIAGFTKDLAKSIFSYVPSKIKNGYDLYFNNFDDYLEKTHKICSTVRTIINKDSPVPIKEIYVKGKYRCGNSIIEDDSLCQKIRDGVRVVVSGFGGIGKTVFCKYFWMSLYENPKGKIPIYFELRNLNDLTTQSLEAYIRLSLTLDDKAIPVELFRDMMSSGRFTFILDGFDEIPDRSRFDIQRQVLKLANDYPDCGFVVSSRADDRFSSWSEFHSYHVIGFDKSQARSVISKIEFDKDIKKEFLSEILEKRYDDYRGFFSTPLLTLMMLMTYMQIKYIPDSPHVFYRYAFQTLYTLHDASKQGFQRKRYVEMSENNFINVFSLFCLVTYSDMEHSFTKSEIIKYFDDVKLRSSADYDAEQFLRECVESVNLIYKDGDNYSFTHRSFQEYFCAYAVTHYYPDKVREVISHIPVRSSDSVFSMMYSINNDIISKMYIIPVHQAIGDMISEVSRIKQSLDILRYLGVTVEVFLEIGTKTKRVGYNYQYNPEIGSFVNSLLAMFKSEIPVEKKSFIDFPEVNQFAAKVRTYISRKAKNFSRGIVFLNIDFANGTIVLSQAKDSDGGGESRSMIISPSDVSELLNSEYFLSMSQYIKSNVVFAKKKSEDINKKYKEIKKSSSGILGL